ncbi:MAG TPA: class I SAM-dependent methyltransferase [Candidatus Thermoplasmatota archaeon]
MDRDQLRENRRVWETLAQSFDQTRTKPWETVRTFLGELPLASRVLDAGCGNGRHAILIDEAGHRLVGMDLSRKLVNIARAKVDPRTSGWVEGAIERLPFKDASFEAVTALAVLHHVRGHRHRVAVLRELVRVLRPGGRALVSVWARDQPRFGPGKEPVVPTDGRPVEVGDAHVRWTQHGLDVHRYIHLFTWTEWRHELDAAQATIEQIWPEAIMTKEEPDNFFAVLRRKKPKKNDANVKA